MTEQALLAVESSNCTECGIVYVAFGVAYQREVRQSLASLRATGSTLPVAVITDSVWSEGALPDRFVIREKNLKFGSRPAYVYEGSPFFRTLLVDADTFFCRKPDRVFGLLDHYDVGALFAGPQLRDEANGLFFHPKVNGGVLVFRKCSESERMFDLWRDLYDTQQSQQEVATGWVAVDDQSALTMAIIKSGVRPVHLGDWMNFVLWRTTGTMSPPVILHGRDSNMAWVADKVCGDWDENKDWSQRVWLPHVGGLLPGGGIGWYDPLFRMWCILRRWWYALKRRC